MDTMPERMFYILCVRHTHSTEQMLLWHAQDHRGYTYNLDDAGVWPESEARRYARGLDIAVPVAEVKPARVAMSGWNETLWRQVAPHFVDRHNHRDKSDDDAMRDALDRANQNWPGPDWDGDPKCPVCGAKNTDWYEDVALFDLHGTEGDQFAYTCNCGTKVAVECSTTTQFRTAVIRKALGSDADTPACPDCACSTDAGAPCSGATGGRECLQDGGDAGEVR